MKRKNPDTSIAAYHSLEKEKVEALHKKIYEALVVLKEATTEKISEYLGMEHERIHKRPCEMERKGMIYKTKNKVLNRSGRFAYTWAIKVEGEETPIPEKAPERFPKGKSATDFSMALINLTKGSQLTMF